MDAKLSPHYSSNIFIASFSSSIQWGPLLKEEEGRQFEKRQLDSDM
jgi:hypothetical protein